MDRDASVQNVKAWVVTGTVFSVVGCVLVAVLLFRPAPATLRDSQPDAPTPSSTGPSEVSAGMTIGFTRPRPAMRMNKDLDVELREWSHLVAKGDQSAPPPQPKEAWYDILVGPSDVTLTSKIPFKLKGHFSNPRVQVENALMYLSGRWIIPTTRRIRGVSPGGLMSDPTIPGLSGASGSMTPIPCANVDNQDEIVEGKLVVFTDATRDVVFFAPGAKTPTATLVLRQWTAGMGSPNEPTPGNEVPECFQISSGYYYVISFDATLGKQKATAYAWNLATGTHDQSIKDILKRVNTQVIGLDYTSVVSVIPQLKPSP
jgi:hypothetical protein